MIRALRRFWKYLGAKMNLSFDKNADPEVQINQAIDAAKVQHKQLSEQAATVIGTWKQAQMNLDRKIKEVATNKARAQAALQLIDDATAKGDTPRVDELTAAAEIAGQALISCEAEVETLKNTVLASAEAAHQAKEDVQDHAQQVQNSLTKKNELLGKLAQAKMQEALAATKEQMNQLTLEDIPSLDEMEDKINNRFAMASGRTELQSGSVESSMRAIDKAALGTVVQDRLAALRADMTPAAVTTPAKKAIKAKTTEA